MRSTGEDENGFLAATLENGAEQLGHTAPVVFDTDTQPGATRVVQQPVLHRRAGQPVRRGVFAHVLLEAVAPVLELAADGLTVVWLVFAARERPQRGTVLGAEDERNLDIARGDRRRELSHQLLRPVAADGLQHRARRIRTDPLGHRSQVIVGAAERGLRERCADLELPQSDEHLDGLRHGAVSTPVSANAA